MKKTITKGEFVRGGEDIRLENFSGESLRALYDYLKDLEEDLGEMEFDPVAICLGFTEYENLEEFKKDIEGVIPSEDLDSIEDIRQYTAVIEVPGSDKIIVDEF